MTPGPDIPLPCRGTASRRPGRSRPAALTVTLGAVGLLAACAGTSEAPTASPRPGAPPACAVVSASRLGATTHVALGAPRVRHKGPTVTCVFPAPDQAQSLIVSVTGGVTEQAFLVDRTEASRAHGIGRITGIGDEGFYSQAGAGGASATTLVVRSGSRQVQVTGAVAPGLLYDATARIVAALNPPAGATGVPATTTTAAPGVSGGGG